MARDGAARSGSYSAQIWSAGSNLFLQTPPVLDLLSLNAHRAKDDPGRIFAAPGLVLLLFTAIGLLHAEEICAAREPSRSCPGLQKYVVGGLASCGERAPWNGEYYKLFEWMQFYSLHLPFILQGLIINNENLTLLINILCM